MDVSSIAAALVSAQAGRTQQAVATRVLKMSLDSQASVLQLLQPAGQSAASGLGQSVDISV